MGNNTTAKKKDTEGCASQKLRSLKNFEFDTETSTLDSLINVMDGISMMVGKFLKILDQKYTTHQLISNLSVFLEFSSYI